MSKKLMRKKLALMLANLKKKRKYYCELEYLKSTGTQWLDLNFIPDNNSGFDITGDFVQTSAAVRFGQRTAAYNRQFMLLTSGDNHMRLDYGTGSAQVSQWSPTNTGGYNRVTLDGPTKIARIYFNNETTEAHAFTAGNFTAANSCYLFAFNNNGTALVASNMTVKTFKLYDNGTLIRDMIPVLDWDMTPCMYDRVTEQLFYNAGTGDFVAGRQIHPVDYIESTGTQYIDTGIIGNLNTKIEAKVYSAQVGITSGYCIAGNFTTSTKAITLPFNFVSNGLYSRFGDKAITTGIQQQNGTHTFAVDKVGYYVDGVKIANFNATTSFTTDGTIMLFGFTGLGRNYLVGKMYYCKIYDNDTLVRDYIPAIDENGVGFMFDRVSHTCFLNSGSGVFKYPAREVEYLEGTGTQYINTGLNYWADFEIGIKLRESAPNVCISNGQLFRLQRNNAENPYWLFTGGQGNTYISNIPITEYHTIKWKNLIISSDGVEITTLQKQLNSGYTLYMFANNNALPYPNMIYFCKLWNPTDGTLVRDFVPAFQDGVACMVDKLTGTAYLNQGTGNFGVGRIVEPEYE